MDAKYHISRDDLILDETKFVGFFPFGCHFYLDNSINSPASVIGKGGFGEVHKAIYHGVTIAVKVFSSHSADLHNTTPHQLIRQEVKMSFDLHKCFWSKMGNAMPHKM